MIIRMKDVLKLFGIVIVAGCAVFVCTIFLNYNLDLTGIENEITTDAGIAMYQASVSMGKLIVGVSGGCLALTSAVMLIFYIKNYIDTHAKEHGILKAIGYSNFSVAKGFGIFGVSVLIGCAAGYLAGFLYLPTFYEIQNADRLFPEMAVSFHLSLPLFLIAAPAILFALISVFYACFQLNAPVLNLLRERKDQKIKTRNHREKDLPFLKSLKRSTLKSKKSLVFFVAFSAFCFSAMVQMSLSMTDLASETFSWMILSIGLILAMMTLFMSLSSAVKSNAKTIAMMRVIGYDDADCGRSVLGAYRPFSYLGFLIGTVYQYALLKIAVGFVFADVANMPEFNFNWKALLITLAAFVVVYESILQFFAAKLKKVSLKTVMSE